MYLGDNVLEGGVGGLVEEFEREQPNASILLTKVQNPEAFGVAVLDGDRIAGARREAEGAAVRSCADRASTSSTTNIFESAKAIEPSFRNELEITDAIQHMIDRGLVVRPHVHNGWWLDTGKKDDMLEANRIILETLERTHRRRRRRRLERSRAAS